MKAQFRIVRIDECMRRRDTLYDDAAKARSAFARIGARTTTFLVAYLQVRRVEGWVTIESAKCGAEDGTRAAIARPAPTAFEGEDR